jgi:hypothetical protein
MSLDRTHMELSKSLKPTLERPARSGNGKGELSRCSASDGKRV